MATKLSNNATGRLAVSIDASDTQLALMPGDSSSFPVLGAGDSFPLTLVKADGQLEIVLVTAASGSVFTVVRGQEGTSPKAFNAGDRVELRLTAGTFEKMISDEIGKSITDLNLGNASQRDVGITSGTVAAGDDSRIVGAMQKDQNFNDLNNKEKARTNLGLGTAAELTATTGTTDSTPGRALRVGDFGFGGTMVASRGTTSPLSGFGAYYDGDTQEGGGTFFLNIPYTSTIAGFRISNLPYQNRFFSSCCKFVSRHASIIGRNLPHRKHAGDSHALACLG